MAEQTIYFAGGCFWGTEHFFKMVKGVTHTRVGFANSSVASPSYKLVCSGCTGAAETVEVVFDDHIVTLPFLIRLYFETIDPTSLNKQGGDEGTQYRTGIYTTSPGQLEIARRLVAELQEKIGERVAVEVMPLLNFYQAEDYHQDYLDVNPQGYCHLGPALFRMAREARDPDAPHNDGAAGSAL